MSNLNLIAPTHAAQAVGIAVETLAYYERIGVIKPMRDSNGRRLYTKADIAKMKAHRAKTTKRGRLGRVTLTMNKPR